jgi:glycosyltransferase involved in cell wall biosynthesis
VAGNYDEIYEATGTLANPKLFRFRFVENIVARLVLTSADLVAGANLNNLQCALKHGATCSKSTIFTNALLIDPSHRMPLNARNFSLIQDIFFDRPELIIRPRILFIGRLLEVKFPRDALAVMEIVLARYPEAIALMAGDGPLRDELKEEAKSKGLESRILFLGNIDQGALSALVPTSIVVSPLTGLALIEAGLGGASIVAYDRDWQSDFISTGEDGFIVPFRDIDAMAERVCELLKNPQLQELFSERIREKALQMTSVEKIKEHFSAQWARVIR